MGSTNGERQIGTSLKDIAPDHITRYEWAAAALKTRLPLGARVLDAACGCAYGSAILARAGFEVTAVDLSPEAFKYAPHFVTGLDVQMIRGDIMELRGKYDAVVTLETVEHVPNPRAWIGTAKHLAPLIVASVPNEEVIPWTEASFPFHTRHFTPQEFRDLFGSWTLEEEAGQMDKWQDNAMRPGLKGRNLGLIASRPLKSG